MNDRQQDPELRAHFEAQRRIDAKAAPSFAAMIARAHAEATNGAYVATARTQAAWWRRRHAWTGVLAAAAAIVLLVVVPRVRSADDAFEEAVRAFESDPALGAWRSPTDGLLDVPGDQLLSTIPSVGSVPQ